MPDGEIETGTPIPAVVPLPTLAMAPLPAKVTLTDGGRRSVVEPAHGPDGNVLRHPDGAPIYDRNPGYPFFVPGVAGHRAPHPPLDFAWKEDPKDRDKPLAVNGDKQYLDGGLPRHVVLDGTIVKQLQTRWDFTKDFILYYKEKGKLDRPIAGGLTALQLPEDGTAVEKIAMAAHSRRTHRSVQPDGARGNFLHNGLPPVSGAPSTSQPRTWTTRAARTRYSTRGGTKPRPSSSM